MALMQLARNLLANGTSKIDAEGVQYGAIPYQIVDGQVVFLMITSRRSANWVFPKGAPIKGLSPQETAAQECFEEAGVKGKVGKKAVGSYLNASNSDPNVLVEVKLFPLAVSEQLDDWPEEHQRIRHWSLLPDVKRLMASRDAARAAEDLSRKLSAAGQ